MELTKKMQKAKERVIKDYHSAIAGLTTGDMSKTNALFARWAKHGSGDLYNCLLCEAAPKNKYESPDCSACPLNTPLNDHRSGCEDGDTNIRMFYALKYDKGILGAVKARLAFVRKRFAENGCE